MKILDYFYEELEERKENETIKQIKERTISEDLILQKIEYERKRS